ncbi:MAG: hypothetical protein KC416_10555 [Myxococcales bacterium]|nr:hypothetical protein [Myxococcales bacterium]
MTWIRRAAVSVALLAFLGGPTPGSIGSCSDLPSISEPQEFCVEQRALYCLRDREADRIDEDEYDACLGAVEGDCNLFNWSDDCFPPPTDLERQACISALQSRERLATPNDMIVECSFESLCGDDG